MTNLVFTLMQREPEFNGFGYLGHPLRTAKTDKFVMQAAALSALTYAGLFLWANSRLARHFMDQEPKTSAEFHAHICLALLEFSSGTGEFEGKRLWEQRAKTKSEISFK